jgi:hypothetical protein
MSAVASPSQKKVADKITKLLKMAQSAKEIGNIEEADAFLGKANDLLLEYNIEHSDLDMSDKRRKIEITMNTVSYHDNQAGSRWRLQFLQILCEYNFCDLVKRSWSSTGSYVNNHMAEVMGQPENVDAVLYLFNNIATQLLFIAQDSYTKIDAEKRPVRYSYLKDYLLGAVHGFRDKMKALRKEQEAKYEGLNGLVLYNAAAIAEYIENKYPDLRKGKTYRSIKVDGDVYRKGYKEGQSVQAQKKAMEHEQAKAVKAKIKMLS